MDVVALRQTHLGVAAEHGQRRPQLVGDVGDERGLRPRSLLQLLRRRLLLSVELPQLVDHAHRHVGKRRPDQEEATDHRE
jgi:hypothetical protein